MTLRTFRAAALAAAFAVTGAGCGGPESKPDTAPPPEKAPETAPETAPEKASADPNATAPVTPESGTPANPETPGVAAAPPAAPPAAGPTEVTIKADWQPKDGGRVASLSLDGAQDPSTLAIEDGKVPDALIAALKAQREAMAAKGTKPHVVIQGKVADNELFEKAVTVAIRAAVRAGFAKEEVEYKAAK